MKQKCIHLRCLALVVFFAICSWGYAQMPSGFPTMPNTGNPSADAESYEQDKAEWMELHPSAPVSNHFVAQPTEAENALAEQNKTAQTQLGSLVMPEADLAVRQLQVLRANFNQHRDEWAINNVRLYQAHIEVFTMARGHTTVNISQANYNAFFAELRTLVDANAALFHITQ